MKSKMNFIRAAFVYGAAMVVLCIFVTGCEKEKPAPEETIYQRMKDPAYTNKLTTIQNAQASVKARLVETYNAIAAQEKKISELKEKGESAAAELRNAEARLADLFAERKARQAEVEKYQMAARAVIGDALRKESKSTVAFGSKAKKNAAGNGNAAKTTK